MLCKFPGVFWFYDLNLLYSWVSEGEFYDEATVGIQAR